MEIRERFPLASHTTLKVGGPADFFISVESPEELSDAVSFARDKKIPITVIGGGSNVLVSDEGVRGLVIQNTIGGISTHELADAVVVTAGAGVVFDDVIAETVSRGWWGLENLSGIPGSVGATPVQNVGAYGVEVQDVITSVSVFDTEMMTTQELKPSQCRFGYRDSVFKHPEGKKFIVTSVSYALSTEARPVLSYRDLTDHFRGDAPTLSAVRDAVIAIRAKKFPDWISVGTAGSFFKNPIISLDAYESLALRYPGLPSYPTSSDTVKVPLGWILDHVCALRGYREGMVGTYDRQALVLVNYGTTYAKDIECFAENIQQRVRDATGISIEREVVTLS